MGTAPKRDKQKILSMRDMRKQGLYLKEIAYQTGLSMSYISRLCRATEEEAINGKIRENKQAAKRCIYPNISEWLLKNNCSFTELAYQAGLDTETARQFLIGKSKGSKTTIDKILFATKMTYEVAFATCESEELVV